MRIGVIGVGTAGITAISHLLGWLPNNFEITSIYDPSIKILGIGESSTPGLPFNLFKGANFTLLEDADELDATIKLGAQYKNWRKNEFKAVMEPPSYAIHFNNFKIKEFCFTRFEKMWGDRFKILEGRVENLRNSESSALVTIDSASYSFDMIVDCRGFPSEFEEYNILENMPVNHCLVNMVMEPGDWNYTTNQATKNGWMFGIPLKTRQGWGYLYNDTITSKEEAVADIEEIFKKTNLDLREFSFKNYHANKFIDGRILKNGNRALFFEPLEATSGFFYETIMRYFVDYLYGVVSADQMNIDLLNMAQDVEMFIHYIYHGGSNFDTKFWEITKKNSADKLVNNKRWVDTIAEVQRCHNNGIVIDNKSVSRWLVKHWVDWDKKLGYNYFTAK